MSNPTLESTIHEILDLKRMREELDAEITALEDSIIHVFSPLKAFYQAKTVGNEFFISRPIGSVCFLLN